MNLKDKVLQDMKQAMKENNKLKKTTLRMLLSEFQYAKTTQHDKNHELTEEEQLKTTKAYHKKLEKSLKDYPDGEQKKQIEQELAIVSKYLPKEASSEEIKALVVKIMNETGEKNFGKLMKATLEKLGLSANAKIVSEVVKQELKGD